MHIVAVEGHLIAQQLHLVLHVVGGQGLAQAALQPAEGHVDLSVLQMLGIQVGQTRHLHFGIQLREQRHGHGQRLVAALGVDGLFIAGGGLGAVVVPQGGAADALGVEVGHLQNNAAGLRQDGVLGAAHDAGQTYRARVVGDHQIVGAQGQLLAVQQQQLFPLGGTADDDVARDVVGVEGVGGLTGSQHDVVGHVHQRVDGTHAHLPDAALHLIGGGLHVQVLNGGGHVTGAALRVLHGDGQAALAHVAPVGGDRLQGQAVQGRQLTGDAVMAPQVGAVGHGLVVDLQNNIVQLQRVGQRRTGRRVEVAQIEDVGLLLGGEQVGKADLHRAADHAVALHAAELALLDLHQLALAVPLAHGAGQRRGHLHAFGQVAAAADDILDLAADIGLADPQLVGVGMLLDGLDPAHHHVVELLGQLDGVLHLHGGHGKIIRQPLQIHIRRQVDVILDPVQ